jgi:hypothetical protein
MSTRVSITKALALLAIILIGFYGCGASGDTGRLSLSITDKPTHDYKAVYVTIQEIFVHAAGDADGTWTKALDVNRTFNLLSLANGVRKELGIVTLNPGHYTQMRLIIGSVNSDDPARFANYVVDTDDVVHEMKIPSGMQTGVKLVQGFDINENSTTELTFDFDASRSVVAAGASQKYLLKPTIHMINDSEIRMNISGKVTTGDAVPPLGVEAANVSVQTFTAIPRVTPQVPDIKDEVVVVTSSVTDSTGAYLFFFLDVPTPTTFNVVATHEGYAPAWAQIVGAVNGNVYPVDFHLRALTNAEIGTVDITVSGLASEAPVTLSFRQISDLTGAPVVEVKSINYVNGAYQLDLPVGVYTVVASTAGKTSLELPLTVTDTPNAKLDVKFI